MQWIKEVELVDSVDELRSSSSTRGISMPNFEVLDARIASALNKIIHNSNIKRRVSLEEQKRPRSRTVSFVAGSRNNGPPSIWDTHGTPGNVFANSTASSSAPHPQESNPWVSDVSEHTSPHVMSESQTPALDQRCWIHSSLVREDFPRIVEQTNNDCRFQILILTNSPRQQRSLVGT